jgi:hypothetical protein
MNISGDLVNDATHDRSSGPRSPRRAAESSPPDPATGPTQQDLNNIEALLTQPWDQPPAAGQVT